MKVKKDLNVINVTNIMLSKKDLHITWNELMELLELKNLNTAEVVTAKNEKKRNLNVKFVAEFSPGRNL